MRNFVNGLFKLFSALHLAFLFVSIPYFCQVLKGLKKIFVAFLAVCILSFSGGLSVVKHYCGDTLKEVSLNKNASQCCNNHESNSVPDFIKQTCCLDQVSFFKTFAFEKQNTFVTTALPIATVACLPIPEFRSSNTSANGSFSLPPPKVPVYKQVQRFLI